jgi:hypothetical protein
VQGVLCEYGHAIGAYPGAARRSGQDCVLGPSLCYRNQKRGQSNMSSCGSGYGIIFPDPDVIVNAILSLSCFITVH